MLAHAVDVQKKESVQLLTSGRILRVKGNAEITCPKSLGKAASSPLNFDAKKATSLLPLGSDLLLIGDANGRIWLFDESKPGQTGAPVLRYLGGSGDKCLANLKVHNAAVLFMKAASGAVLTMGSDRRLARIVMQGSALAMERSITHEWQGYDFAFPVFY